MIFLELKTDMKGHKKEKINALVTGGLGFVGSHLTERLIKEGFRVIVVDNLSSGRKENLNPGAKLYKIDIQNPKIAEVFQKEKPRFVFHFAAQINVRKSLADPLNDAKINILGTLNVLENCRKNKVKKFIFPSSVGVYGDSKKLPIKEDFSLNPLSPYSVAKLAVEKYLNFYQAQGLEYAILRYANIFGPRQSAQGEGGVVAKFIDDVFQKEKPIIFGSGNQTRDFLYVADAVEAAILAAKKSSFVIYNVGTNTEVSVRNLLKLILELSSKKIEPIFEPFRQGEILKSRIDFSKIKKELNWQPKYNLIKGLVETIDWYKNYIFLKK